MTFEFPLESWVAFVISRVALEITWVALVTFGVTLVTSWVAHVTS